MATYIIQVPDNGVVKTYNVSDEKYNIKVQKITQDRISKSGSPSFAEMVAVTGAIADGQITFKNRVHDGIKELDEFIGMTSSGFVAFYIV